MTENNDQQMIDQGNNAEELINSAAFKETFAIAQSGTIQHWMTSKPEEEAQRTSAYYMMRGFQDIAGLLQQQIQIRDQILDKLNSGADNE